MNHAINWTLAVAVSLALSTAYLLDGPSDHQAANRAYEGADPTDRLAFEVGMLHSKLREMSYLLANAVDHIKELEIELAYERK